MDPYKLLELEPGASEEAIKKAWKRLARAHHPDLNQDDPEAETRFKRIKQAYDALMEGDVQGVKSFGGGRRPDGDWLDSIAWMAEVRRREVMVRLLPRFVGTYGVGATLAWALRQDEDLEAAAMAIPLLRPRWSRWRVRRMKLDVVIDERGMGWGLASIDRRGGRVRLMLNAPMIWQHRPKTEDQLREVIFAAVDHGLAAAVPAAIKLTRIPQTLEEARSHDQVRARDLWFWRLVWAGAASLTALMISWTIFSPV